jgi:hypothetical protein
MTLSGHLTTPGQALHSWLSDEDRERCGLSLATRCNQGHLTHGRLLRQ